MWSRRRTTIGKYVFKKLSIKNRKSLLDTKEKSTELLITYKSLLRWTSDMSRSMWLYLSRKHGNSERNTYKTKHLLSPLTTEGVVGMVRCWAMDHSYQAVAVVCQSLALCNWFLCVFIMWRVFGVLSWWSPYIFRWDHSRCPPIRWLALIANTCPL